MGRVVATMRGRHRVTRVTAVMVSAVIVTLLFTIACAAGVRWGEGGVFLSYAGVTPRITSDGAGGAVIAGRG